MEKEIRNPNMAARVAGGILMAFFTGLVAAYLIMEDPSFLGKPGTVCDIVFVLAILAACAVLLAYQNPYAKLTADGVYYRFFLRQKFIPWADVAQAGIIHGTGRGEYYQWPVALMLSEADTRLGMGIGFRALNLRRMIRIVGSPEVRDFVTEHYGPLDFDMSDRGKKPLDLPKKQISKWNMAARIWLGVCVCVLAGYCLFSSVIGGNALDGYREAGRYFIAEHGYVSEVQEAVWYVSYVWSFAFFGFLLLTVPVCWLILRLDSRAERKKRRFE